MSSLVYNHKNCLVDIGRCLTLISTEVYTVNTSVFVSFCHLNAYFMNHNDSRKKSAKQCKNHRVPNLDDDDDGKKIRSGSSTTFNNEIMKMSTNPECIYNTHTIFNTPDKIWTYQHFHMTIIIYNSCCMTGVCLMHASYPFPSAQPNKLHRSFHCKRKTEKEYREQIDIFINTFAEKFLNCLSVIFRFGRQFFLCLFFHHYKKCRFFFLPLTAGRQLFKKKKSQKTRNGQGETFFRKGVNKFI